MSTPTICPHCGERPPRPAGGIDMGDPAHYCLVCVAASRLIRNSGSDQLSSIKFSSAEVCLQAQIMEEARGAHCRRTVMQALRSRVRQSRTTVLVACPKGNEPVWLGYFDGDIWRAVEAEPIEVTHWQPLPEPPSKS